MANTTEEEEAKTPTTSDDIRNAVETAGSADESVNDDDEEQKDDDAESEADESKSEDDSKSDDTEEEDDSAKTDEDESKGDDDADDSKKSDDKSEYRFSQFAGDGKPETYITNLEKAYSESSAEGIRLNDELKQSNRRFEAIKQAVSADPDLAEKLNAALTGKPSDASPKGESQPTTDPFLVDAKTKWEETSTREAEEFIQANPEVVSDPTINADVKHWMEVFSGEEYRTKGRLMTAGEAMAKAYKHLGLEDKREARKSVSDAKKAVAPTRPQGSRKPAKTGSDFTDSQLDLAAKMGVSKEKLDKFGK